MLGVTRLTQVREGLRSSEFCRHSKIRDAVAWARLSKIRWTGHVMRFADTRWTRAVADWIPWNVKRIAGRPPTRWWYFFVKALKERYEALRVPRARRTHWITLTRERICPFFRCRQMQETAELILLPYNYIIDPQLRKLHKLDLSGSIVIFDEAHNLESICEDVVSVEISSVHIALAIAELKDAIESLQSEIEDTRNELVSSFLAILSKDSTTWDQVVLSLKLTLIS
ncbi:unnamed protein product [Heligmosomoides polygyrus]|uniref:Helicase ATP-binding domain-containing protein n=1 Tax=Heligmosomoides polygyrus TaxID=6339 RepID=A0A183GB63_HELPZ|nr:unnamed protein product [Heligmosomoides polygyrus]